MLKRHEIKVLLKAGHSRAEVARLAGVSVRSVKRIVKEGDITSVDDRKQHQECGVGRPNLVGNFRKPIGALLKEEPGLKSVEILCRARLEPIEPVHVHHHLAEVLVRELPELQVDEHEAAQQPVLEDEVHVEVIAVEAEAFLALCEAEAPA